MAKPGRPRVAATVIAFLATAIGLFSSSMLAVAAVPIGKEFQVPVDRLTAYSFLPAAGALAIVFVTASFVSRWGVRLVVIAASTVSAVGAAVILLAESNAMVTFGQFIGKIGFTALSVAGLTLLQTLYVDPKERARAFGALAALAPLSFLVVPVLAGLIIDNTTWRVIPLLMGVAAAALGGWTLLHRDIPDGPRERTHLVTPIVAGLSLAVLTAAAALFGIDTRLAVGMLVVAVLLFITAVILARRTADSGFSFAAITRPGAGWFAGATFLVAAVGLAYYVTVLLHVRFQLSSTTTALWMILPQASGIAGSFFGGWLSARIGAVRSTVLLLLTTAGAYLLFLRVDEPTGAWYPVLVATLAFFPIAGTVGPMTQVFVSTAPPDGAANASAWREALRILGANAGGALVAVLLFANLQGSLERALEVRGLSVQEATAVAQLLRSGTSPQQIFERYPNAAKPLVQAGISGTNPTARNEARTDAIGFAGVVASIVLAASAGMIVIGERRRRRRSVPMPSA